MTSLAALALLSLAACGGSETSENNQPASTADASMPPAAQGLALWALAASERALERLDALDSASGTR